MTLDEVIEKESKIAKENQKIVDTQIVFDNVSISELYCDDTEVIEEHLSNYRKCAEHHEQLAEWLEELKQYREIGTQKECRAAVEKQKAKKPIIEYEQTHDCVTEIEWKCPVCGTNYVELAPCGEWCRYCGTKFDWGDEE